MTLLRRHAAARWIAAFVAVAAAAVLRLLLDPVLGGDVPYITFFAAVALTGFLGGGGPAVLSVLLGGLASVTLIPGQADSLATGEGRVGLLVYAAMGTLIAWLTAALRSARLEAEMAARDLRLSEEWLRVTLSSIGDAVLATDTDGHVTMINGVAESLTGWTNDAARGRPLDDVFRIVNEDSRQTVESPVARALRENRIVGLANHTLLIARDGSERPIEDSAAPIRDASGGVLGVVLVFRDASSRRSAERDLRQAAERLGLALAAGGLGVWEWDVASGAVWWSEGVAELHGLPPGAFDGTMAAYRRLVHPDDRALVESALATALHDRTDYDLEFRVVAPDGGVRWVAGKGKVFCGPDGEPRRVVGVAMEITARREAAEALRESEARVAKGAEAARLAERTVSSLLRVSKRLNSTLDVDELLDALVQEAIALADAHGGACGLLGPDGMSTRAYFRDGVELPLTYTWGPGHGLPGWLIVHRTPYLTNDAATDPQIVQELRSRFGVKTALSVPILDSKEQLLGFFEIHDKRSGEPFTDRDLERLTAVAQVAAIAIGNALAYRRLQEAEAALKEADRRKDEFLATLAHELRNPLAPIRTSLEVASLPGIAEAQASLARDIMKRQVGQMVRLIDDLLDVSRITRNRLELRCEPARLQDVVAAAVETAAPLIRQRGHELELTLPEAPVLLEADVTRLAQVFANLLNNAAAYTEPGGRIGLAVRTEGDEAVVDVSDTGPGIASADRERIFEMFARGSAVRGAQAGLGIGLGLARRLVELHRGRIDVSSSDSSGTTFTVRLPLSLSRGLPLPATEPPRAVPRGLRILVADDNRDAAQSLATLLGMEGHEVRTVKDGREAVEEARRSRPHVAILDVGMPVMDGHEAARRLRSDETLRGIVLIALTGWGQAEDRFAAMAAGFDHHVAKPVDPAVLHQLLRDVRLGS